MLRITENYLCCIRNRHLRDVYIYVYLEVYNKILIFLFLLGIQISDYIYIRVKVNQITSHGKSPQY